MTFLIIIINKTIIKKLKNNLFFLNISISQRFQISKIEKKIYQIISNSYINVYIYIYTYIFIINISF